MKKTVLMLMAAGTWVYAGAQRTANRNVHPTHPVLVSQLHNRNASKNDPVPTQSFYNQSANDKQTERKGGGLGPQSAGAVPCGSAYNLYGVLDANTTAVTADQNLNTILFTHREDASKSYGSGAYEASISTDMGVSWDTSLIIFGNKTTRYPNGVLSNPNGASTYKNAYWVVDGPFAGTNTTDPYVGWDSIAFGSMKFDSSSVSEGYKGNGKPGIYPEEGQQYMSSSDNKTVHSMGDGFIFSTSGDTYTGSVLNTGTFNATNSNFDWTQTLFRPHLMPTTHSLTQYDTIPELLGTSGSAWSQDGMTGYVVIFGNLDSTDAISGVNLNFVSYQPIVYKTTDGGTTWNMMPPHNWRNDSVLVQYLRSTADSANVVLPIWRLFTTATGAQGGEDDYDLVVDKNNNLHIIGGIEASAMANPDSSNYLTYYARDFVFDMYTTTSTGGWRARYIDTLASEATQIATSVETSVWNSDNNGKVAIGHRIQASRTTDGSKIFATWMDDVVSPLSGVDSMYNPDMFGQGYDITTGRTTAIKRFTSTDDRYFICVSNIALVSGASPSATYRIPVVRVEPPSTPNDGLSPVYFLYDTTDMYTDNDFVTGIPKINAPGFSITPNYPNPFNGLTQFGVNLTKESLVNVNVYNLVGQKVWSMSPEKMGSGLHTVTINASGFSSGIYFYRVTVAGHSLTQKMIVE